MSPQQQQPPGWTPNDAALAAQYAALMRGAFQQQQAAAAAAALGLGGGFGHPSASHLLQHQTGMDPLAAERLQQVRLLYYVISYFFRFIKCT